jgi:Na+-translocating ferredoxin:NAD+ oxidoreductase RnfD subunit
MNLPAWIIPGPMIYQMMAHWIYILFSLSISTNLNGLRHVLVTYAIIGILHFILKFKNQTNFSLISLMVVINSTYLNLQIPPNKDWTIVLISLVAIFFKFFFRSEDGKRTVVNPSIVAIMLVTFLFPDLGSFSHRFWTGEWYHIVAITAIGTFVTFKAKTLILSLSYVGAHIISSVFISYVGNLILLEYFMIRPSLVSNLSLLSFGSCLFIFHVISDPQSGPKSSRDKIIFGASIGILDASMKFGDVLQSGVIAYMLVTFAWVLFSYLKKEQASKEFSLAQ